MASSAVDIGATDSGPRTAADWQGFFDTAREYDFEVECDTFISSFGGDADAGLYFDLKGRVDVQRIGDAVAPVADDVV